MYLDVPKIPQSLFMSTFQTDKPMLIMLETASCGCKGFEKRCLQQVKAVHQVKLLA